MDALKLLFTSDVGLMSLGAIVVTIGIGFWFSAWFNKQIERESRERGKG